MRSLCCWHCKIIFENDRLPRAINRKFHLEEDFTKEQLQHIKHIMQLCDSENEINDYRKLLKEKLGDYIVNVVEAHANHRLSK
ncbi:hypothetical protein [Fibrobacter sp.]|uniref:hypothetical protein n=1 Tax=Fibrobacter sp. TaxID=35828 RepID=UPI00386C6702